MHVKLSDPLVVNTYIEIFLADRIFVRNISLFSKLKLRVYLYILVEAQFVSYHAILSLS